MKNISLIFIFLCLFASGHTFPKQKKVVFCTETGQILSREKKLNIPRKAKSMVHLQPYVSRIEKYYRDKGYLSFSVDSIRETSDSLIVTIFKGKDFSSHFIHIPDSEFSLIEQARARNLLQEHLLPVARFPEFAQTLIVYLENNGFPFAEVYLDSVNIDSSNVAQLHVDPHQLICFDSLISKGTLKLSKSYLYPYLGIRRHKVYREKMFRQVPTRLSELPFASEARPPGLEFSEDKAWLYIFLNKQKINQFNGIIALVPVSERTGKLLITGDVNLSLYNIFTIGEELSLQWRAPGQGAQYLYLSAIFPYLLWSPFGVKGTFLLDKTDTSYLNMHYEIGLQYSFRGHNYVRTYFDFTTSNVLSESLLSGNASTEFLFSDYRKPLYGVEVAFRHLDHLYIPRKGFSIILNGAIGQINILESKSENGVANENIAGKTSRYRVTGEIRGYVPLHRRWVLLLGASGGSVSGKNTIENELFKIGGTHSLRGFDEQSIMASSYLTGLCEWRFFFSQRSYIQTFFNGGWYEKNVNARYLKDTPWGFGLGIAFQTRAGMFSISYALGKQWNNPLSFKTGKVHFGMDIQF